MLSFVAPCISAFRLWPGCSAGAFRGLPGVSTPSGTVSTMRHIDAHAGFQRAQLLEPLALFQRRWRQRHEALQRGAAIGVEADVVVERPVAGGRGGAGEIERAQPPRRRPASRPPSPRSDWCAPRPRMDLRGQRRDVDRRIGERRAARRGCRRARCVGRSPCTLTTISASPSGSSVPQRLENAVGAGGMIGARHHGRGRRRFHRGGDLRRIGRHHHRADAGRLGPPQHMHDHRHAGDVGQRLAGQAGRGHAGRDQDRMRGSVIGVQARAAKGRSGIGGGLAESRARLYGLPERGQTGISIALGCGAKA